MLDQFSRTQLLVGKEAMDRLANSRVAIFGIGGVGGYVVEALARSGVGTLDLIDDDKICLTNLNRQIIATRSTIGKYKVDVAKARVLDINPKATVNTYQTFYVPETAGQFDFSQYDYVVDAIDTVTGKINLVMQAQQTNTPISVPWELATRWTPQPSGWQISIRPVSARWQKSCAGSSRREALRN